MQSIGFRYGLIGGLAVIAYFALLYAFCLDCFLNPLFQWGILLGYIALLVLVASRDGQKHGFDRDFRDRVRTPFLAFIVANVMYWLFYYSLHLADPALLEAEAAQQLAYLRNQLESGTGDPAASAKIREQIVFLEKEGMTLPLGPVFMQMGLSAIGGFMLAAGATFLAPLIQPTQSNRG